METQTGVPNSPQAGLAGGAKLKNAGFLSPVQKMDLFDLIFIHNFFLVQNWAILSGILIYVVWDPLSNGRRIAANGHA